ncbi:MAG: SDR family oxidoreductase [Prolixibacteraceae bacterium]|nr:SDR family oxidoreductase [Prolixibacteraceae bacterium]
MDLKNKVVIITGASSGIGKAIACKFAQEGCRLTLAARRINLLEQLKEQLNGTEVLIQQTDVSKEDDCKKLIEETIKKFGKIDILVNDAGISMRALFEDLDLSVIHQVMNVNFWGTVNCTKFALPYLLKTKGSVVGVISIAGYMGLPGRTGYSASKFAIRGFLNTLRIENLKKGLHVLIAAPGFTSSNVRKSALTADGSPQGETPRKENKMMSAEKCAGHIIHAVKKRKNQIILTFTEGKVAVFLEKIIPGIMNKLIYYVMSKEPNSPLK